MLLRFLVMVLLVSGCGGGSVGRGAPRDGGEAIDSGSSRGPVDGRVAELDASTEEDAGIVTSPSNPKAPDASDPDATTDAETADAGPSDGGGEGPKSVAAFYFGHSLLAGSGASANYHLPYNVGVFATQLDHEYDTHGQLGWGTPIVQHWAWSSDDLSEGPLGFTNENHAPFYPGQNGKAELATGDYDAVVFTDVNGNAQHAVDSAPVVQALVGFIELAREQNDDAQPILYSCWNAISESDQANTTAVEAWSDTTLSELAWWESVTDAVNEEIEAPKMLLVPVSAVVAQLAMDAANGLIQGSDGPLDATELFIDDVHGTPMTYYAAGAAVFTAMFRQSPVGATTARIQATISGANVDYTLPSDQAARHIQQRAYEIVRDYPRAGLTQ